MLATWGCWAYLLHLRQHSLVVSPPWVLCGPFRAGCDDVWCKSRRSYPPGQRLSLLPAPTCPAGFNVGSWKSLYLFYFALVIVAVKISQLFWESIACDGKRDGWFIASVVLKLKAILTIWGSFMALFSFAKCQVNWFCPLQVLIHQWNR